MSSYFYDITVSSASKAASSLQDWVVHIDFWFASGDREDGNSLGGSQNAGSSS